MAAGPREVSLPAEALAHLQAAVVRDGGEAGVRALHAAGYASGRSMYRALVRSVSGAPESLGQRRFFEGLSSYFRTRGWGTLTHESGHPGLALLTSGDWAEADRGAGCAFSSGVLAALFTQVAGAPVAVLETGCRGRGDDRCTFAFGSEGTVQSVYDALLEGRSLDDALHALRGGDD